MARKVLSILTTVDGDLDAEQRKLLEFVFECFENAGKTLKDVSGANIGCYVGKFTYDYLTMQNKDAEYLHRYSATGMSNLQGPGYDGLHICSPLKLWNHRLVCLIGVNVRQCVLR